MGNHVWSVSAKNSAASDSSAAHGIATAANGDAILVGEFSGNVDFGAGTLTANGSSDLLLAKIAAADGKTVWSKQFGGSKGDRGLGVAVDSVGSILMAGSTGNAGFAIGGELLDFGGTPGTFVAKVDTDGVAVWGHPALTGEGYSTVSAMAIDTFGKTIVVGSFSGTEQYHYSDISSKNGSEDAFIAKVDEGGTTWINGYGDMSQTQRATAIAIGNDTNVAFAGTFRGSMDFGGASRTSTMGSMLLFLTTVDKSGAYIADKSYKAPDLTSVNGMCLSAAGEAVAIGTFYGSLDLGTGVLGAPNGGAFVAKLALP